MTGQVPAEPALASEAEGPRKAAPDAEGLTLAWVGDITPGSRYGLPPESGRSLFAHVRPTLRRPDLTIGNLEGTFSVGGASKCGSDGGNCFSFQAPPENAESLRWAGFDVLNLANNHANDFGEDGRRQTLAALDSHGLAATGRPDEIRLVRVGDTRVALLGFAPYPWASDIRDLERVRGLVSYAARQADVVVVLMHAGAEGSDRTHVPVGREVAMGEDRGDTRAFAHAAVDSGADVVLGSGPHVLRGLEQRNGRLIAYSLGNFAGYRNFATSGVLGLSAILEVRLAPSGALASARIRPVVLDADGIPRPDPRAGAVDLMSRLSTEDFADTAPAIAEGGEVRPRRGMPPG